MTRAPHRRRVVAVIGNNVAQPKQAALARDVGRGIVGRGWRLVTGGLGGVMEAASEGARGSEAYREGDVVGILPMGDASEANRFVDIAIPTNMGYARNTLVVTMADAVVAVGGGAGTLSEIAMAWQLGRPIVALDIGGWSARLAGEAVDDRDRPPVDRASTAEEALARLAAAIG